MRVCDASLRLIYKPANLWPQPRLESKRKDLDEDRLHDEVCSGQMTLGAARAEMLRLWRR